MGLGWANDWIAPADRHPLNFRFNIVYNVNKKFTYINAFPIDIGAINLASDADQFITFPVTFKYDYFTFA